MLMQQLGRCNMPSRESRPSIWVSIHPSCNPIRRPLVMAPVLALPPPWKSMEDRQAMTAYMGAAIRRISLFSFVSTGCWCTSKEQYAGCQVALMRVLEGFINFNGIRKIIMDDLRSRAALHRNKASARFRGSMRAHSGNGAGINLAKMNPYQARQKDSVALPRFYIIANESLYGNFTKSYYSSPYESEYHARLKTRWFIPASSPFSGDLNTLQPINGET